MRKPILCLDFDGVIHSYGSGWSGPRTILDPPVPGALEFIVRSLPHWQVAIHSSRSSYLFGRWAMQRYLSRELVKLAPTYEVAPKWWQDRICETAFADPWKDEVYWAASRVIFEIQWPRTKPPAMVTLDDRAITFTGEWPSTDALRAFQPWNKRKAA